jgi:hypothetical protein
MLLAGWFGRGRRSLVAGRSGREMELLTRAEEGGCAPGLESLAHGPAGLAVRPFVELPLLVAPEFVELGEADEFAAGDFMKPSRWMKRTHRPPMKGQMPPLW